MNREEYRDLPRRIQHKPIIIYGAHLVAMEVARWLKEEGLAENILGFAVTDTEGNPECVEGVEVRRIEAYVPEHIDAVILIAAPAKYHNEIEETCKKHGFTMCYRIGLETFSEVKGCGLIQESKEKMPAGFELKESTCDTSWLDLCVDDVYCKFPTLFYRNKDDVWSALKDWQKSQAYTDICRMGEDIHKLSAPETYDVDMISETMQIYMAFGEGEIKRVKEMDIPAWVQPLQVGCAWTEERYGNCFDDEGDSLAKYNRNLAEMTAAYAVWKNQKGARYKGLCHYRRHFVLTEQEVMAADQNGIDVILTIPRYVPFGIKSMFLAETPVKEPVYEMMLQTIKECHKEDVDAFCEYMDECFYYPNNMVVARANIYDDYCEWIFPVLMRMLELDKETGYGHETDRHVAYAAELLTSFYFVKNRERYRVAVTEYRFEG